MKEESSMKEFQFFETYFLYFFTRLMSFNINVIPKLYVHLDQCSIQTMIYVLSWFHFDIILGFYSLICSYEPVEHCVFFAWMIFKILHSSLESKLCCCLCEKSLNTFCLTSLVYSLCLTWILFLLLLQSPSLS